MESQRKVVQLDATKLRGRAEQPSAAPATAPSPPAPAPAQPGTLEERVVAALKTVCDPELPINIYELGLIYELKVEPTGAVYIKMTLTSPGCPVAGSLVEEIRAKVAALPGVTSAKVDLVWEPPWDRSRMSEAAQLEFGFF